MKTVVETAKINFRVQLASLKAMTGYSNADVGKLLGCTDQTVSNMYRNPLSARGEYVLIIQEYLRREEAKIKG